MDDRYGALINKFNRMLMEDVNRLVQSDMTYSAAAAIGASRDAPFMALGAINRAQASAFQSHTAMAQFHASSPYTPGSGIITDLARRLNSVGVYADPQRMAVLSSNVRATRCRLSGEFKQCWLPGRKLTLRADAVDQNMLDEVCSLVKFETKGKTIDTTGLLVSQAGKTYLTQHRPLRYVEKATKLLAIYVIISDHMAPDFLSNLDI